MERQAENRILVRALSDKEGADGRKSKKYDLEQFRGRYLGADMSNYSYEGSISRIEA